ncbi:MAG: hypothetical protein JWM93_3767, partial [Frankiales bacterium]|nr:hypothetical protein [Frankiales bacterium]
MDIAPPDPGSGRCLSIGGLSVLVTATPRTEPTVAELFGAARPHHEAPQLSLTVVDEPVDVPTGSPTETYDTLRIWRDGDRAVIDSGGGVSATVDSDHIDVRGQVPDHEFSIGLRRVLHHALAHLLSLNGRTVVHGAAVARGDVGLLLLGATGSGKSTCAYLAATAGWDVIADDLIALWVSDGVVLATGVPRSLSVPREVLAADEPGDDRDALHRDSRQRRRLARELRDTPCPVRGVAIVRHGNAGGSLEAASGADLMRFIVGS